MELGPATMKCLLLFILLVPTSLQHRGQNKGQRRGRQRSNRFRRGHTGEGFDLLFTDNLETYQATPIYFQQPTPDWSKGSVIRNGVGQFSMGDRKVAHAFDGFGKLTKISLNGSNVGLFTHKFTESSYYKTSVGSDTIAPFMLFQNPQPKFSLLERAIAMWRGTDNVNVNILRFSNTSSYFANSDFWPMYNINGDNLNTLEKITAKLPQGIDWSTRFPLPSTSHPLQEHGSEDYISFVNVLNPLPWPPGSINVVRMTSLYERKLIASIPVKEVPYMHAFGLSKNYAVIFANPAYINVKTVVATGDAASSIEWKPEQGVDIYAVNIHTGKVQQFHTPKAECNLHFVNAWESRNKIFVDYVNYRNMDIVKGMEMSTLKNETLRNKIKGTPRLVRYTLHLKRGLVRRKHLGKKSPRRLYPANHFDFPQINPLFRFQQYCYVYGIAGRSDKKNSANSSLIKKDLCGGKKDRIVNIPNHYFQEPQFVPKPNAVEEDSGILVVMVMDGEKRQSYVAIYDANDMTLINKAWLPTAVPFSFHGGYFPGQL